MDPIEHLLLTALHGPFGSYLELGLWLFVLAFTLLLLRRQVRKETLVFRVLSLFPLRLATAAKAATQAVALDAGVMTRQ